jgi:hypothetical protein
MKAISLLLAVISATTITYAMQQPKQEDASPLPIWTDYPTLINTGDDQFIFYFQDLDQAKSVPYEDQRAIAQLPLPLFQHLCVQAQWQTKGDRAIYVKQLATKLRLRSVKIESNTAYITPKDLHLRLLTAIPMNKAGYSLLNGKKTKLEVLQCETEQDKQDNELAKKMAQVQLQSQSNSWDNLLYQGLGWASSKPAINPADLKRSGLQVTSSYNVESDPTHHAYIVAEFNNLITFK